MAFGVHDEVGALGCDWPGMFEHEHILKGSYVDFDEVLLLIVAQSGHSIRYGAMEGCKLCVVQTAA